MSQPRSSALSAAVSLLARRDHSKKEISDKLAQRSYSREEIDEAIQRLCQRGYLNDETFCRKLADSLWESGKYGFIGVMQQLRRRGLPEAIICESMDSFERDQELQYAVALLKRRKLAPGERNKAGRFLATRGFSYAVIEQALEHFVCLR